MPQHRSTKACSIAYDVKKKVWERDNHRCIVCGDTRTASPVAHYIPRSQLGLGIEENIVTLCLRCHCAFDNSISRPWMKAIIRDYLMSHYEGWDEKNLVYKKYGSIDEEYRRLPFNARKAVRDYMYIIKEEYIKEESNEQDYADRESHE